MPEQSKVTRTGLLTDTPMGAAGAACGHAGSSSPRSNSASAALMDLARALGRSAARRDMASQQGFIGDEQGEMGLFTVVAVLVCIVAAKVIAMLILSN